MERLLRDREPSSRIAAFGGEVRDGYEAMFVLDSKLSSEIAEQAVTLHAILWEQSGRPQHQECRC
jgi:hypothetical protein